MNDQQYVGRIVISTTLSLRGELAQLDIETGMVMLEEGIGSVVIPTHNIFPLTEAGLLSGQIAEDGVILCPAKLSGRLATGELVMVEMTQQGLTISTIPIVAVLQKKRLTRKFKRYVAAATGD